MTSRILIVLFLLGGLSALNRTAYASAEPSSDDVNEMFVEHLNFYYQNLHLQVLKGSDPDTVFQELEQLEDYQSLTQKESVAPPKLLHLVCTSPACGPCSRGPC